MYILKYNFLYHPKVLCCVYPYNSMHPILGCDTNVAQIAGVWLVEL